MKITADEIDNVRQALRAELAKLETSSAVTIGIHEKEGAHDGGISNAQLGAVLDLGDERGHIPARPWLAPGVESAYPDIIRVIQNGLAGADDAETILERVGAVAAGAVQHFLTELRDPPNAASTIAAKNGKDNPLIHTGELRQAINYERVDQLPEE